MRVISKDDLTNPGTSLSEVETLVSQDHVVGLVDDTVVDAAWATYVSQEHIPVVGGNLSNSTFYTNPDFYPEGTTQNFLAQQIVLEAKKVRAKTLAVMYCAEAVQCQEAVPPIKSTGATLGVPLVYSASISSTAPNYVAQCLAAKQSHAGSVNVAAASAVVIAVAASCHQQGYDPVQLGIGGGVGKSWATAPGMEGTIATQNDVPFFVHSTPATSVLAAALTTYAPNVLSSPGFGEAVTNSWVSGLLISAAARDAGVTAKTPVTASRLVAGLDSFRRETLDGMAPPLTFRQGQAHSVNCFFYMRIQGHAFTTPYGLAPSCLH